MAETPFQSRKPPRRPKDPGAAFARPASPSITLLVWLLAQIGALMLAALRIPLWTHAPASGEFLALQILGTTQILAGALLFPLLMRDWKTVVMVLCAAWPMLLLAGFLASAPIGVIVLVGAYVTAWLLLLAIWRLPLPSTKHQLTASAIAAGWAGAGPILIYAHAEFPIPPLPPFSPTARAASGPIIGLFTILDPDTCRELGPWLAFTVLVAIAAGLIAMRKRRYAQNRLESAHVANL